MFLATTNKVIRLLHISFIGDVEPEEIHEGREMLSEILEDLPTGLLLLVDLERLHFMSKECAPEIGWLMELFDRKGVAQVIRVIPDKTKDIGLQVLYLLHYKNPPPLIVCASILEAENILCGGKK